MTDPIPIPVHVSDGSFRWHCHAEITPDLARQIVALGVGAMPFQTQPDGSVRPLVQVNPHYDHQTRIDALEQRIAALEKRAHDGLSLTEPHSTQDNGRCVAPVGDKQDGDEAAVEALVEIISSATEGELTNKQDYDAAHAILTAIRDGKVPGVWCVPKAYTTPAHNCGICGEYVTEGQYHDCKPVPGKMLEAMRAERDAARAEVERLKGELAKAQASQRLTQKAREDDRGRLQQKCSDWGTYWRASDAHGVKLNIAQSAELLMDALGVEVEIEDDDSAEADKLRGLLRAVVDGIDGVYCEPVDGVYWFKARDAALEGKP